MTLTESMEDYLEAIFEIEKQKRVVRVRDVASRLGVTMPSVNGALKNLEAKGLISHEKYEYIELTDEGINQASKISLTHSIIFNFLKDVLGIDEETANADACRIEHDVSQTTIDKLTAYVMSQKQDTEAGNHS